MTDIELRRAAARGELAEFLRENALAVQAASREVTQKETRRLQLEIRRIIARDFPSARSKGRTRRVENAIRSKVYPRQGGGFTGLIWSKFGSGRGAAFQDYLLPFVTGATIKPSRAKMLLIPFSKSVAGVVGPQGTKRVGRSKARAIFNDPSLETVPLRSGRGFLIRKRPRSKRARKRNPIALLLTEVKIERRLNFEGAVRKAELRFPRKYAEAIADED